MKPNCRAYITPDQLMPITIKKLAPEPVQDTHVSISHTDIASISKEHLDGIKIVGSYGTKIDCLVKCVLSLQLLLQASASSLTSRPHTDISSSLRRLTAQPSRSYSRSGAICCA